MANIMHKILKQQLEALSNKEVEALKVKQWSDESLTLEEVLLDGVMVNKIEQKRALEIYHELYQEVISKGFQIFLTNMNISFENCQLCKIYYDIGIIKAKDQYEVIKLVKTEAPNFDHTTEDIIEKIKSWAKYSKLQLTVVDNDRIEGLILDKPKYIEKFAKEIYDFAPDVVEQGTLTKKVLVEDLKKGNFWLWWD